MSTSSERRSLRSWTAVTACWAAVCIVVTCRQGVTADMFSAVVDLERLLHAERAVADDLRAFVDEQMERLEQLRNIADDFESHSTEALADTERYLGNPVNAFLLIKRFTRDWNDIIYNDIRHNDTEEFMAKLATKTCHFPSEEDLHGAAEALLRLQDTYALSTSQIARGDLMGVTDSPQMTAEDCFGLGSVAYTNQDYYHTVMWMTEALHILETEPTKTIDKATLLDYLSYSLYMQGNVRHALKFTNEWLQLVPNYERALSNKGYYEQMIVEESSKLGIENVDYLPLAEPVNRRPADTYRASNEFRSYERLCRGEKTHDYERKHELSCKYLRHHPMFYIKPVKEEEVYLNPRITIYHDVITPSQLEIVRRLARPRLQRSVVYHTGPSGTLSAQNYRISKSAWLSDWEHPKIERISHKASAIANLTLLTVEPMQVLNYGIGGHYEPHYDFAQGRDLTTFEQQQGNRIATFLCYATDVTAGGATVFPEIGVQLWPKLGSCALWYNLHRSGEGDLKTRHAACPVLTGLKWVCNKWFHERGQEFIRSCSTSADE